MQFTVANGCAFHGSNHFNEDAWGNFKSNFTNRAQPHPCHQTQQQPWRVRLGLNYLYATVEQRTGAINSSSSIHPKCVKAWISQTRGGGESIQGIKTEQLNKDFQQQWWVCAGLSIHAEKKIQSKASGRNSWLLFAISFVMFLVGLGVCFLVFGCFFTTQSSWTY